MATTTNYSWTTPDDTDLVKDGAAAIRTLGTAIDTTVFTNAGAAVAKATVDAKGDLIAGTADNTIARLAVGANDTVLTADSSTATGLKWAAPSAGGKNFTLLNAGGTSLSGSTTTISSISGYDQFFVRFFNVSGTANRPTITIRFNGDDAENYYSLGGQNEAKATYDSEAISRQINATATSIPFATGAADTATSAVSGALFISGANTAGTKIFEANTGSSQGGGNSQMTRNFMGIWDNASVISSISFILNSGTYDSGTVHIYGAV